MYTSECTALLYNPNQTYSTVAGVGLNPSNFLTTDIYPQIVVPLRTTVDRLKEIVQGDFLAFNYTHDHHRLHDLVTQVTLEVRKDDKLKPLWESFLMSLDKRMVCCPDEKLITLDFTPELDLLKNPKLLPTQNQIKVEKFTTRAFKVNHCLQMDAIFGESFAKTERGAPSDLESLVKDPKTGVFVAIDEVTRAILGSVIVKEESQEKKLKYHIISVARKANAAKRGVANILLTHIFENHIPQQSTTVLEVRKSNKVAIELYKKFGFKQGKETHAYYSYPKELAYEMTRQPEVSGCVCTIQ